MSEKEQSCLLYQNILLPGFISGGGREVFAPPMKVFAPPQELV